MIEAPRLQSAERLALAALVAFGALLPAEGLGRWSPRVWLGMQASDLPVVLASPFLLIAIGRHRRSALRSPIVLSSFALAAVGILVSLLRDGTHASYAELGKLTIFALVVGGLAAVGTMGRVETVLRVVTVAGTISVAFSLAGYVWFVTFADPTPVGLPFGVQSSHPALLGLPRLTGTFQLSPQRMGEFAVVLLAASWAFSRRWASKLTGVSMALATSALLLTLSSAWVGALAIAAGALAGGRRRWAGMAAGACVAAITAGVFCVVNFGPPLSRNEWRGTRAFRCEARDNDHFVTWFGELEGTCHQIPMSWPYRSVLTTYWQAKSAALVSVVASPVLGLGRTAYRRHAAEAFTRQIARGPKGGVFYHTPHCTLLEVLATQGAFGGLAFIALVAAIGVSRPAPTSFARPLWLAGIGLLLIGLNADLLERRPFWALLGLLAAATQPRPPATDPRPVTIGT